MKIEEEFLTNITCTIAAWARLHDYDENDTMRAVGEMIKGMGEICNFKGFRPTYGSVIRSLNNKELAEYIRDICYECSPGVFVRTWNIPGPCGGYLVQGDEEGIEKALKEEAPIGKE